MSYVLYGSETSPFVRRIRMLLETIPYDFRLLNIFETEDALTLNRINPVNQIPVLTDGGTTIWDSRQIFNYVNARHKLHEMSWETENTLTAIDGAMNAGVTLLLMKRSGMNTDEPYMYVQRQKERIGSVLSYLRPYLEGKGLEEWNFITMTLYCFFDWADFRKIINLSEGATEFLATHANRSIVTKTAIPKV